jgi:predicted regulator of Ras-like GTPase activity (Roadblock/LC7/MglB family)
MSEIIRATLLALKDVSGVQGGFVLAGNGSLVAMEMPPLFDADMFAELGPRIERLSESFASLGDDLESCMVRFSDHVLCVKRFARGGALCVLAMHSVNLPALRMAMNLADKRLANQVNGTGLVGGAGYTGTTTTIPAGGAAAAGNVAPAPAPPAARPTAAPAARKIPRYYRGHLVED